MISWKGLDKGTLLTLQQGHGTIVLSVGEDTALRIAPSTARSLAHALLHYADTQDIDK